MDVRALRMRSRIVGVVTLGILVLHNAHCFASDLDNLNWLVMQGNVKKLSPLLKKNKEKADECLMTAAYFGKKTVVDLALACGANPHARANQGLTALHLAVSARPVYPGDALALCQKGDYRSEHLLDERPLWTRSATADAKGVIDSLLSAGADVNAKSETGETPLTAADFSKSTELAQYLLDHGAKRESTPDLAEPLHVKVSNETEHSITAILVADGGSNSGSTDRKRFTFDPKSSGEISVPRGNYSVLIGEYDQPNFHAAAGGPMALKTNEKWAWRKGTFERQDYGLQFVCQPALTFKWKLALVAANIQLQEDPGTRSGSDWIFYPASRGVGGGISASGLLFYVSGTL